MIGIPRQVLFDCKSVWYDQTYLGFSKLFCCVQAQMQVLCLCIGLKWLRFERRLAVLATGNLIVESCGAHGLRSRFNLLLSLLLVYVVVLLFALLVLEILLALLDLLLHVDELESLVSVAPQSFEQHALLLLHVQTFAHVVARSRFEQVVSDGSARDLRPLDCWPCVLHYVIELAHL